MINKIAIFFWEIASWKTFLAGLILYLFFGGYVMPAGVKAFEETSGHKVEILDLQFSYSLERATSIISDYSDSGRKLAIKFGLIADTIYPLSYTFFFTIMFTLILKALSNYGIRYRYLHLFPLLILVTDYFENIGLATMFFYYPNFSNTHVVVTSLLTTTKWSLLILLGVMMIAGLIALTYQKLTKAPLNNS